MTNMNNPNDSITIGRLINVRTGFTNVFRKPIIKDAMIAEEKFFTQMPSIKNCVRYTAIAVMPQRMMSEIMSCSQ